MEFECKYNIGKKLEDKRKRPRMQVPKFKDFITEKVEREGKPITIAVVTKTNPNLKKRKVGGKEDKELTVKLINDTCEELGIKCVVIETRHAIITGKDEEKNTLTIYNYDGKDTEHTFIGKDRLCNQQVQ